MVEDAAILEVCRLHLFPTAKDWIVNAHELQLRKAGHVFRIGSVRLPGTVVVVGNELLGLRCIKEVQKGFSDLPRSLGIDIAVYESNRRNGIN